MAVAHRGFLLASILLAITLSSCPGAPADGAARLVADTAFVFGEVRPDRTSDSFRSEIEAAMRLLEKSGTPVALATLDEIRSGRVRVDALSDLTRADYRRMLAAYEKEGEPLTGRWENLATSATLRKLESDMSGWMWDDRVYVARGLSTKALARVLAHEVNHVRNRSEEHYRGKRATLAEEYRAFLAEDLAFGPMPSPSKLRALKLRVIRDYELDGLTPDDVTDLPPGRLAASSP